MSMMTTPSADQAASPLRVGDFVRVRPDGEFRAGQDGMVMAAPDEDGTVGMLFLYDRYNRPVRTTGITGESHMAPCEGIEAWHLDELDLSTVEH